MAHANSRECIWKKSALHWSTPCQFCYVTAQYPTLGFAEGGLEG